MSVEGGGRNMYWDTKLKEIDEGKNKGRTYMGQWKCTAKGTTKEWTGLGEIHYADGSKYQGVTKSGKYHGKGRMTHKNGDMYHGQWERGKASGVGVFLDKKGSMYDGEWFNDQYHGKGEEHWDYSKIKYVGDFIEGQKTGQGKFEFDGNIYEGSFLEGQFHGRGVYYFADS